MAAQRLFTRLGALGVGIALTGSVAKSALFTVDGGQRAVIFDRFAGIKKDVIGEGTHFMIPMIQNPILFDIRSTPHPVAVSTGSKDLQTVDITLRILYRPIPEELPRIFGEIGVDYAEKVLPSITKEVLKAVVAQFDASDMITQRETVSQQVSDQLSERAKQFSILLDDISITHLSFGREFTEAVELKVVAQQEAERARYVVEKAEQQKKAAVITAEGDAIAAELLSKAFQSAGPGLVELRKIEAAEEIALEMAKARNIAYLPPGQQTLLNIT